MAARLTPGRGGKKDMEKRQWELTKGFCKESGAGDQWPCPSWATPGCERSRAAIHHFYQQQVHAELSHPHAGWQTRGGFLRQPTGTRLGTGTALPEERELRKMMWRLGKEKAGVKTSRNQSLSAFFSGRNHDFIQFQQVVVPTVLHNKHWRRGFGEHIRHHGVTC